MWEGLWVWGGKMWLPPPPPTLPHPVWVSSLCCDQKLDREVIVGHSLRGHSPLWQGGFVVGMWSRLPHCIFSQLIERRQEVGWLFLLPTSFRELPHQVSIAFPNSATFGNPGLSAGTNEKHFTFRPQHSPSKIFQCDLNYFCFVNHVPMSLTVGCGSWIAVCRFRTDFVPRWVSTKMSISTNVWISVSSERIKAAYNWGLKCPQHQQNDKAESNHKAPVHFRKCHIIFSYEGVCSHDWLKYLESLVRIARRHLCLGTCL